LKLKLAPWIKTVTGKNLDFLAPAADQITAEDIAYGLANECRFGRQCRSFGSVAQHSVMVMNALPKGSSARLKLLALLHDAAEAYTGDIPTPLKQMLYVLTDGGAMVDFEIVEHCIANAIYTHFGLEQPTEEEQAAIKKADDVLLLTEARDHGLLTTEWKKHPDNGSGIEMLPNKIEFWEPEIARNFFQHCLERSLDAYRFEQANS
jgi:hypothetical protein